MSAFQDLTGQVFADLTVVSRDGSDKFKGALWLCKCVCGNERIYSAKVLKCGDAKSCGCRWVRKGLVPKVCKICGGESIRKTANGHIGRVCHACASKRVSGFLKSNPTNYLVNTARSRAKKHGVPFTITKRDVMIPELCPILGCKLELGTMEERENSPSIDRIIPALGYVPGNIAVVSFRANRFKSDYSPEELRKIADWIEKNRPEAA